MCTKVKYWLILSFQKKKEEKNITLSMQDKLLSWAMVDQKEKPKELKKKTKTKQNKKRII